jgi:S-formylglutathione hydrolase FrmB
MRRLALTLVAASVVFGGTSLAIAQTTTTVVTQTTMAAPTYYSDYYRVPYYKTAPSMAEMAQILVVWTGTATMENHPVQIRFDRQGIWQLTK